MTTTRITTATLLILAGAFIASVPLIQAAAKRTGQDAEDACLDAYNACWAGCSGKAASCDSACNTQYQSCMADAGVVFVKFKKRPQAAPPTNPVLDKGTTTERDEKTVKTDAEKSFPVELQNLRARSNRVVSGVNFNDAKAAGRARAQLAKNRAAFAAYAKAHGFNITSKEYTHPATAKGQTCGSDMLQCSIVDSYIDDKGVLHCVYDCAKPAAEKKPK